MREKHLLFPGIFSAGWDEATGDFEMQTKPRVAEFCIQILSRLPDFTDDGEKSGKTFNI